MQGLCCELHDESGLSDLLSVLVDPMPVPVRLPAVRLEYLVLRSTRGMPRSCKRLYAAIVDSIRTRKMHTLAPALESCLHNRNHLVITPDGNVRILLVKPFLSDPFCLTALGLWWTTPRRGQLE